MMRVPESFLIAYEEELALVEPLRLHAGSRLRILAANNSWLFDDRVKSAESALSKVETGSSGLRDMKDLYAAMIVVPTQKHVSSAVEAVLAAFTGKVRDLRLLEASSFVYDDVHIHASLRGKVSPRAVPHASILDRKFEIQIHTGAQYAWWRATHDDLYKGSSAAGRSWAARRASGQARASLELIDGVLADFESAGHLQTATRPEEVDPGHRVRGWLDRWSPSKRPTDEIRFVSTATGMTLAIGVDTQEISELFATGRLVDFISAPGVTPVQVVLIACHLLRGPAIFTHLAASEQRVFVTEEMLRAYPAFGSLPAELAVAL